MKWDRQRKMREKKREKGKKNIYHPSKFHFSQINGDQQPKKGILKRPSVVSEEKRDKLFPLPGFRASPDRFPEKGTTRIPKLQVTWWEKNAGRRFRLNR